MRMQQRGDPRVGGVGIVAQISAAVGQSAALAASSTTAPARVVRQLLAIARIGEKRERSAHRRSASVADAVDARLGIAAQLAAEPNGELPERDAP